MSEIQESLEWRSVLNAVVDIDIRATLTALDAQGVIAYTDGACLKNPGGPAGWSALLWQNTPDGKVRAGATRLECYGHIPKAATTTNNRAEIAAVLAVLSLAPPTLPLLIHSDSEYTIKVAQGTYQMKANPDMWAIYRKLLSYRKVPPKFEWVRGHAGHEHNERADELAGLGAWNNDQKAYAKWQTSQAPEARNGSVTAEQAPLQQKVQTLQLLFKSITADSARVSAQERTFINDMAKRLQKNTFVPSEKQSNWIMMLAKKHKVE